MYIHGASKRKLETGDPFLSFQEQSLTLSDAGNVVCLGKDLISFPFSPIGKKKRLPPALTSEQAGSDSAWLVLEGGRAPRAAGQVVSSVLPSRPSGLTLSHRELGAECRGGGFGMPGLPPHPA